MGQHLLEAVHIRLLPGKGRQDPRLSEAEAVAPILTVIAADIESHKLHSPSSFLFLSAFYQKPLRLASISGLEHIKMWI